MAIPGGTVVLLSWMQAFNFSFDWGKQLGLWFIERIFSSGIFTFGIRINTSSSDFLQVEDGSIGTEIPWEVFARGQTWLGAAIGIALIAGAIWIRRYRDENI